MPMILVTPLSAVPDAIRIHTPSHIVTLLSPEHMIETPTGFAAERHLRLAVNDIADPMLGDDPPAEEHVQQLLTFARGWDADAPMLVHCWAGVSRSMAAAFAVLCDRLGPGSELALAREMRARAPHAYPNRLLVRLADNALGREGEMVRAVESIGIGTLVSEGFPVELPIALGKT